MQNSKNFIYFFLCNLKAWLKSSKIHQVSSYRKFLSDTIQGFQKCEFDYIRTHNIDLNTMKYVSSYEGRPLHASNRYPGVHVCWRGQRCTGFNFNLFHFLIQFNTENYSVYNVHTIFCPPYQNQLCFGSVSWKNGSVLE